MAVPIEEWKEAAKVALDESETKIDTALRMCIAKDPTAYQYSFWADGVPKAHVDALWSKYQAAGWSKYAEGTKEYKRYFQFNHEVSLASLVSNKPVVSTQTEETRSIKLKSLEE